MQVMLVEVRKALADKRGCPYERFYVVYGRKPGTAEDANMEAEWI